MSVKCQDFLGVLVKQMVESQKTLDGHIENSILISNQIGTPVRSFVWGQMSMGFNISCTVASKTTSQSQTVLNIKESSKFNAGLGIRIKMINTELLQPITEKDQDGN